MKEKSLVVKVKKNQVAEVVDNSPAGMIRAAVAGGADLEKLKGLLELQERFEANQAKKAYHKAMAAFKANLPQIIKDKKVSYSAGTGTVKYSHATLFNIMNKITPELSKHGLSVAWTDRQDEKTIFVTCRITHELGYSEETTIGAPADVSGSKNAIQAIGSTISYLERYSVLGLIGAATKDQDDDAKSACPLEYISESQLSNLLYLIDNNKISKSKFLAYMKLDKLENMPKSDFQKAMTTLNNIANTGKP